MLIDNQGVGLMLRAKSLITAALWQHIYDEDNGETPDANCSYSQWLEDCDRYLTGEMSECQAEK